MAVLIMAGLVPLILREPTVRARCKSRVALVIVKAAVVTPLLPPKVPELVTVKVPPLMLVVPVYVLAALKVVVPLPAWLTFTLLPAKIAETVAAIPLVLLKV